MTKQEKEQIKKIVKKAPKWTGNRYMIVIGGLEVYFKTLQEANDYYKEYLK